MNQPLSVQCLVAAISGFLAHGLYFIHWTDDRNAMKVLLGHVIDFFVLVLLKASFLAFAAYLVALFTSITVYRLFFHRQRRFPGPVWASITKAYGVYANRDGKLHEVYDQLLHQYGPFVRIGLYTQSSMSKCTKGNVYATLEYGHHRVLNLDSITDKTEHRFRRQVWDRAFSGQAIDAREKPTRDVIHQWLAKVDELQGQPLNWTLFASLISFDITGHVGFSVDFGGVRSGEKNVHQQYIQSLFKVMADAGQQPWLIGLAKKRLVAQYLKDAEAKEDIFHYFIDDFESKEPQVFFTQGHLECDAQAILIGAADSSIPPQTLCFWHLILSPGTIDARRAELSPLCNCSHNRGFINADLTCSAPFLNAIINETMRLYSSACTNAPKQTPPGGIRYFVSPRDWIPERWTTKPELVLDKPAYHPFSTGPFNCVGQRQAMMTLRMVTAYTVWFCNVEFAPGEDGRAVVRNSRNQLFLVPGPLKLVFNKRLNPKV
ncbi:cytochrome P450 [Dactylonectria estremocensis]|uniref:Cytochrome P450 n=1 Tax=Dactylonectria estremocensis TaxID=1079267 RepID=A0A9P9EA20_9HYPO|nr:cytochrome P450 [Dactylonectria estremocensis]